MDTSPQLRTAMMYGAFSGISSFLVFIIIYMIGKNPLGMFSWLAFWIPILFIILGIQNYRDKELGGYIGYGRALGTGVLITLFLAILFSVLSYAFLTFIGTDILEVHKLEMIEGMEKAKQYMGDTLYETGLEEIDSMTIGKMALGDFQNKIIGGVFVSLFIAAFLRKRKPLFEEQITLSNS